MQGDDQGDRGQHRGEDMNASSTEHHGPPPVPPGFFRHILSFFALQASTSADVSVEGGGSASTTAVREFFRKLFGF
jgi:hypothetical protein